MLTTTKDGPVGWIAFDREDRLNAFTVAGYRDLRLAIAESVADPGVRVVVVTGHGRAFSVGADRSLLDPAANPENRAAAGVEFAGLLAELRECPKPLLGAVNGLAVGFGCTLLLYFDLVLAADSARFRLPFTSLGIVPEAGSTALLPARARMDATMWAMLSSEWFDARTAQEMGIVWRVCPAASLRERTAAAAASIAAHDPASVVATKRLLTAGRQAIVRQATERELVEMARLTSPAPTEL